MLTETPSLDERLTARDNLLVYADLYGVPQDEVRHRVAELLEDFELADRADEKAGGYSRGMKQRLALARTLLHSPQLLFLDEPTSGLDPLATRHVHEMIVRMSRDQGRTVFLCTHNLAEAQQLCDRVAVLQNGRVLALGSPSELAHRLGQHQTLEIELAPEFSSNAIEILRSFPGVEGVTYERGIAKVTGADRETVPHLLAALVVAGVRVYRVTPQEATLEDAYFALYGEKEAIL